MLLIVFQHQTILYKKINLLRPPYIEHFKVIFDDANFFLFVRLIEVFKDNSNIHVDDDHEVDNDEWHEESYCYHGVAAITWMDCSKKRYHRIYK